MIDCYLFQTYGMSSPTDSLNNFYGLFKSLLQVDVLTLPQDSPPIRALMEGAGIDLLIDFLLQPPSYYKDELTYIEVREDGSTILMALHPTYVSLLMAFYLWCHEIIGGNCTPPTPTGSVSPGLNFYASWRMFLGKLGVFLILPSPSSESSLGLYLNSSRLYKSQFSLLLFLLRR